MALEITPRQLELTKRWADGYTYEEVAAEFELTPRTVKYAVNEAYRRLGIETRGARGRRDLRARLAKL